MQYKQKLEAFSDDELIQRVTDLVGKSRRTEWELVAHIGEVEKRKLYAQKGRSSMHLYCTEVLHLSDAEAYLRIAAARASRKHRTVKILGRTVNACH